MVKIVILPITVKVIAEMFCCDLTSISIFWIQAVFVYIVCVCYIVKVLA